jgi:hypothetical protein
MRFFLEGGRVLWEPDSREPGVLDQWRVPRWEIIPFDEVMP